MENELDMEDIESRLYSQVHHSTAEEEQLSNVLVPARDSLQSIHSNPYTLSNVAKPATHRYFHKEHPSQPLQSTYISFDDKNSFQNNISVSPTSTDITTEGNFSNQFQNNITVNQYTVPVIINSELNEVLNPPFASKYFTSWAVQNQHIIGKKKKKAKLQRRKEKKKQSKVVIEVSLKEDTQRQVNDIICVSDDSDDDCIIQDVSIATPLDHKKLSTGFPKKYNDNDETSKKPESDDDIIFIPPPPIEVVNVDGDDKEQEIAETPHETPDSPNSAKKLSPSNPESTQKELTPESSPSNDFLDSTAVENSTHKFNFSLHGSDFNNSQGEFVRPANPVDFCETESSCSTNELNRDFNNSVKTVVFDEVEFPREDIFSGNNLEKFGTYITPRRNKRKELDNAVANSENTETEHVVEVDSLTDSSPESDNEHSTCVKRSLQASGLGASKKLPTLSPMLSDRADLTTPKRMSSRKKIPSEFIKDQPSPEVSALPKKSISKKKLVVDVSESDSDTGKETSNSEYKKLLKKKKKKMPMNKNLESCADTKVDSDSRKKKKKKYVLQNSGDDDNMEKSQNKKKKGNSETNNSESGENTDECTSQKKRRKSLRPGLHEIKNNNLGDVLEQKLSVEITRLDNSEQPSGKKKKSCSESNSVQSEESSDLSMSSSQKKKIKNSQERKTPQHDNIEASLSVHQTDEIIRHDPVDNSRSRKKKVSSESNSGNEDNTEATRKKKRNRSGSNSSEKDNAAPDSESMVKKKKDRYLESVPLTQPECINQETVKERSKKKKRKSQTDDIAGDKRQKDKKITFSELLSQSVNIEDRIEAEVQKKKKKKLSQHPALEDTDCENMAKFDDLGHSEMELNPPQEKKNEAEGNNQQPSDEGILSCKLNEIPVHPTNQSESAAMQGAEEDDSDEELIVVDDIAPGSPNLIIIDEAESTVICDEVVLSSDSEYDFKELSDVGKDLELANCIIQGSTNDDSEEMIVVDDDSGGNLANRYALDQDYSNFDVDAIQSTQTDDPEAWKVSYKDRAMIINRRPGIRCNRCRQFGHLAVKCTEKLFPPNCSLCGKPGHQEPRCPNKMCRQCGNQGDYSTSYCWKCFKFRHSICKLCNMEGHIAKTCPDLWRRYHLTTDVGPIRVSREPQLKPKKEQWCSGCAKRGHLVHECRNYFSEFPTATPRIVRYEDVLYCANVLDIIDSRAPPVATAEGHNVPSSAFGNLPSTSKDISNVQSHIPSQSSTPPFTEGYNVPSCAFENLPLTSKDTSKVQSHIPSRGSSPLSTDGHNAPSCAFQNLPSTSKDINNIQSYIPTRSSTPPSTDGHNVPSCAFENLHSTSKDISNIQSNIPTKSSTPPSTEGHNVPSCAFENLPSTSKDISNVQSHIPPQSSSIPSLLSLNIPKPSMAVSNESTVFPSTTNNSLMEVRNSMVLNPFSVIVNRRERNNQLDMRLRKAQERNYKKIIMSLSSKVVVQFLQSELAELDDKITQIDPRFLLKQFIKYSRLMRRGTLSEGSAKDKYIWYKRANMFIFGVHKLKEGYLHVTYLRKYVSDPKQELDGNKRKALLSAYSYIFGADCHSGIKYPSVIGKIIRRYDASDV